MKLTKEVPERVGAFDIFTYHAYCDETNQQTPHHCAQMQIDTVKALRQVLPAGMPIFLEETGSSAGPYVPFHDTTGEAAFVVAYVAGLQAANLSGAHWWCASDLYTEHGSIPNYTWIPNENYSGGMPRSEFTGRWGFTTPSGIAKPIHRAFELLHSAGTEQISTTAAPGGSCGDSLIVLGLNNSTGTGRMIFVANNGRGQCNVTLAGLGKRTYGWLHRIDHAHGNPYGLWQSWGSPPFPKPEQVSKLQMESSLKPTLVELQSLVIQLGPNALHVLVL